MTYEQHHAMQAMIKVHDAMRVLRDSATIVMGLHMAELSEDQRNMIHAIRYFAYADVMPPVSYMTGDGNAWTFEKFLTLGSILSQAGRP